jgi:hypothetical protein
MSGEPHFPDLLGRRELLRPGATQHKAGPTIEERIAALERGAISRPPKGTANGCVNTSDNAQTSGVAWTPYYSTAWTTIPYATGWSTSGIGGYATPAYSKNRDGVVSLRGLVKKANNASSNGVICTLPVGCRPPANLIFNGHLSDGASDYPCDLYVESSGNVTVVSWLTAAAPNGVGPTTVFTWLSLAAIRFDTA